MPSAAVSWSSSDPRVVAVDGAGLATAMGHGTATVTATAGTVSAMATVAVAQVVASVKVTPAAGTVVEADTLRLAAVAADANGHAVNDAVFAWASNDTTVAVIDDSGLVTGVAPGHAMATATAAGVSGGAELVVAAAVPTAITVTPETVMLAALGQNVQLSAEVLDQIGRVMADVSVSWSSYDPRVVAVDGAGLATAMGRGTATVTATAGTVSAMATVTVAQVVASVKVTPASNSVVQGDTLRLAAVAADANGHAVNDAVFAWASNDTTVAVIDDSGLVTGVTPGHAMATATAAGVSGGAELVVAAAVPAAITVTPETVMLAALGQNVQLSAEVLDQIGRVMADVSVSWSSSDPRVVAVDGAGLATAMGRGTATITAAAGDVWGTAEIMVEFSLPPRYPIHLNFVGNLPDHAVLPVRMAADWWSRMLGPTPADRFTVTQDFDYSFGAGDPCDFVGGVKFVADDVLEPGLHLYVHWSASDYASGWACEYDLRGESDVPTDPLGFVGVNASQFDNAFFERDSLEYTELVLMLMVHEIGHVLGIGTGDRWWDHLEGPDTLHGRLYNVRLVDPDAIAALNRMAGGDFPDAARGAPVNAGCYYDRVTGKPYGCLFVHWEGCAGHYDLMGAWKRWWGWLRWTGPHDNPFGFPEGSFITELTLASLAYGYRYDRSLVRHKELERDVWNKDYCVDGRSVPRPPGSTSQDAGVLIDLTDDVIFPVRQ